MKAFFPLSTGLFICLGLLLNRPTLSFRLLSIEDEPLQATDFIRFVEGEEASRLQTAIATYTREDGVSIDLIGAVHIGEPAYYQQLNEIFRGYESLLYELVADSGEVPAERSLELQGISVFQIWLKNTLKLEFQLHAVDYRPKNFVHADLDLKTFARLQKERGESFLGLMFRAFKNELKKQERGESAAEITWLDLLRILFSKDRTRELKLLLARQFDAAESSLEFLGGDEGSVILTERNKAALQVMDQVISEGRKHIGIFYGAAHLPDMEKRLRDRGFKWSSSRWLDAWLMPADPVESRPEKTEPGQRKTMEF